MGYPKRLMGWVRDGNTPYDVKLKHEPNLFCPNRYVVYQISKLTALPTRLMFDAPAVKGVHYRNIYFWGGYTLSKGSEVMVEYDGVEFKLWDERRLVRLSLYPIPDNIR